MINPSPSPGGPQEQLGQILDQESFECLLYCLELDRGNVSSRELDLSNIMWVLVFCSMLGVSLVSEVVRQQVETKLCLAQQLLVLQQVTRSSLLKYFEIFPPT